MHSPCPYLAYDTGRSSGVPPKTVSVLDGRALSRLWCIIPASASLRHTQKRVAAHPIHHESLPNTYYMWVVYQLTARRMLATALLPHRRHLCHFPRLYFLLRFSEVNKDFGITHHSWCRAVPACDRYWCPSCEPLRVSTRPPNNHNPWGSHIA